MFLKMNNTAWDISVSGVGSIDDVSSERVLSSKALLSLSASCLFVPTDCCFVVFEQRTNITFCVLLYKSPSEALRMHEEGSNEENTRLLLA
jgi:hypothetical protein